MQDDKHMVWAITAFLVTVLLYFMPTLNARSRAHPSLPSIFLVNLLLGWTLIGWLVAIMWSTSGPDSSRRVREITQQPGLDKYQTLDLLGSLKERGLITDEEFQREKHKVLQR